MVVPRPALLTEYAALLRAEPRARSYLLATLADDIGIAVAGWATLLLYTNLITTQRQPFAHHGQRRPRGAGNEQRLQHPDARAHPGELYAGRRRRRHGRRSASFRAQVRPPSRPSKGATFCVTFPLQ